MAQDPLDTMIEAHAKRKNPSQQLGFMDLLRQLMYPNRNAPVNQPFVQLDANGNPIPLRTVEDVLAPRPRR